MKETSLQYKSKIINLRTFNYYACLVLILLAFAFKTHSQNYCQASSANDKLFTASSNLLIGMIKPGINSYVISPAVLSQISQNDNNNPIDYNALQIAHSKIVNQDRPQEHRIFFCQYYLLIKRLFLAFHYSKQPNIFDVAMERGQLSTIFDINDCSIHDSLQEGGLDLGNVCDRQMINLIKFLDTLEFILSPTDINHQYNKRLKASPQANFNGLSSSLSINLFIVGLRFSGSGPVNVLIKNQSYNISNNEVSFQIQKNQSSTINNGLYMIHISYVIFDKLQLQQQFIVYYSQSQLNNQSRVDYWMKGLKGVNYLQTNQNKLKYSEFYFFKINRLKCSSLSSSDLCTANNVGGCLSIDNCMKISGIVLNDNQCIVCKSGQVYNNQSFKCQLNQTLCKLNQTWNGSKCVCKLGFILINGQCGQCPFATTYNSNLQRCQKICQQNQTNLNNQCICANQFYLINGKCSKCQTGYTYDSIQQTCVLSICGLNQFNLNGKCVCIDGYFNILGVCSKCPSGTIYNSLNRNCTQICAQGNTQFLNGKCVCKEGFYQILGQCSACNIGQTYNPISKSCQRGCKINQYLLNGSCYCNGPYINNVCSPCNQNQIYNSSSNQCIPLCPQNSYFNSTFQSCVCNKGYYVINSTCSVCPAGSVYDLSTLKCQTGNPCTGLNQVYFRGLCICDAGYVRINNDCSNCPNGTFYNSSIFNCQTNCSTNQIFNSTSLSCQCDSISGFYKVVNGSSFICQKCPLGTQYNSTSLKCQNIISCKNNQVYVNGQCVCPNGTYLLINSTCGICQISTIYNSQTLACDKICSDPNSYYQNGVCLCYPPYVIVNITKCQQCQTGFSYDLSTQSCKNNSTPSNLNVTCNTTSQIRKLNISNGAYYCACNQANSYFFIYDRCGICQTFTKYNPLTLSCELNVNSNNNGIISNNNSFIIVGCSILSNKVYQNGTCKCISTAIKVNTACAVCPTNSIPNSIQTQCICMNGFQMNRNNSCIKVNSTVNSTSQQNIVKQSSSNCSVNQIWNGNSCVCQSQFYRIFDKKCYKCTSFTNFNGSNCVCQNGYYSQSLDSLNRPNCKKCHQTCLQCSGPGISQCLKCSNVSSTLTNGICLQRSCQIGSYFQVYQSSSGKCQKCTPYCKICSSATVCNQCIEGFEIYQYALGNFIQLQICSEICGDGRRYQRDCDDGNLLSGDGCSKECQIQDNWICVGGTSMKPDICSQRQNTTKAIIEVRQATIQMGNVNQNVRLSYIPSSLQQNQCALCSNLIKVNMIRAKILPDSVSINYIQKSKYQFNIKFTFFDILSIPPFKFSVQLNPVYKDYFSTWDINQVYEVEIDSALLSLKNVESYLRVDQIK